MKHRISASGKRKLSYSVGGFTFRTDALPGRTPTRSDDIANVFLQYEFTPQTSAHLEYRYRHIDGRDSQLNFFSDDVLPNLRTRAETENYRLGLRQMLAPNLEILRPRLAYQSRDTHLHDETPDVLSIDIREP